VAAAFDAQIVERGFVGLHGGKLQRRPRRLSANLAADKDREANGG